MDIACFTYFHKLLDLKADDRNFDVSYSIDRSKLSGAIIKNRKNVSQKVI